MSETTIRPLEKALEDSSLIVYSEEVDNYGTGLGVKLYTPPPKPPGDFLSSVTPASDLSSLSPLPLAPVSPFTPSYPSLYGRQDRFGCVGGVNLPSGNQMHLYGPNSNTLTGGGFTDPRLPENDPNRHVGPKLNGYESAMSDLGADLLGFKRWEK